MKKQKAVMPNVARIKELAKARKLKLYQVAERCGFSPQYLINVGYRGSMDAERAQTVADFFGVPLDEICLSDTPLDVEIMRQLEDLRRQLEERNEIIKNLNDRLNDKDLLIDLLKERKEIPKRAANES